MSTLDSDHEFQVVLATLVSPAGVEIPCLLHELSREGVDVTVLHRTELLSVGSELEIVLNSRRLPSPLRAQVAVRALESEGWISWAELSFVDRSQVDGDLPLELWRRSTRRKHARLALAPFLRVEITRTGSEERVQGDLLDLSCGGMKVVLRCSLHDAAAVGDWGAVELSFGLPGVAGPLLAAAQVRRRFGVRLSLEFEGSRTRDFAAIQEAILAFTTGRVRGLATASQIWDGKASTGAGQAEPQSER